MAPFNIKRVKIDIAAPTIGDNTLIAAVTGKKIVVLAFFLHNSGAGAQIVKLKSGAATDLTGPINLPTGGVLHPTLTDNWEVAPLRTAASDALVVTCSAATQISGYISYMEMT